MEAGRFGETLPWFYPCTLNRNEGYYTRRPGGGKWASDGGALMNQCIHGIDLLSLDDGVMK